MTTNTPLRGITDTARTFQGIAAQIDEALADSPEALAAAEEVSNLDPEEYVTLGPIPSTLMVHDIIGSDMAQVLYAIHGDWAGASIGEKIAYMQTIEIAMRDLPGQPATV